MVSNDQDQIFILDFGVGCLLAETEGESLVDTMSTANAVASGLDCASPERHHGVPTNLTPLGDQPTVSAATLYYMLAGQFPFPDGTCRRENDGSPIQTADAHRGVESDVPSGLVEVVQPSHGQVARAALRHGR